MSKWNVIGANDEFLGVVDADSEAQALEQAAKENLPVAKVEEKPEHEHQVRG